MNKQMQMTVKRAQQMSLTDAKQLLKTQDQLRGVDWLRWMGYGTPRYEMNLSILEAAREIVEAEPSYNTI